MGAVAPERRRHRVTGRIAVALLYVFVLLGSAFVHHDLECHLTSRTHCTSCVYSHGTPGVAASPAPSPAALPSTRIAVAPAAACALASAPLFYGSDSSPPPARA